MLVGCSEKQESVFKASSELGSDEGYHSAIESVTLPKCVSSDCRHRQDRLLARLREEHVWKVLRLHVCSICVLVRFFHPLSFRHMDTLRLRRKWIPCDADTLAHQNDFVERARRLRDEFMNAHRRANGMWSGCNKRAL